MPPKTDKSKRQVCRSALHLHFAACMRKNACFMNIALWKFGCTIPEHRTTPCFRPLRERRLSLAPSLSVGRASQARVPLSRAVHSRVRTSVWQRRTDVRQRVQHAGGGVQDTQTTARALLRRMQLWCVESACMCVKLCTFKCVQDNVHVQCWCLRGSSGFPRLTMRDHQIYLACTFTRNDINSQPCFRCFLCARNS